jgi:uncharacterized protein YjbJ (UPF0337 family)
MSDLKKDLKNTKDKLEGEALDNLGQATDDEEMELKGKLKKKVVEAKEKVSDKKDDVLDKINDKLE